jgi:hypothetical protein
MHEAPQTSKTAMRGISVPGAAAYTIGTRMAPTENATSVALVSMLSNLICSGLFGARRGT